MNTIECSDVEVVSGKPCDPLQILHHPKHNTLYVGLQGVIDTIIGHRTIFLM